MTEKQRERERENECVFMGRQQVRLKPQRLRRAVRHSALRIHLRTPPERDNRYMRSVTDRSEDSSPSRIRWSIV